MKTPTRLAVDATAAFASPGSPRASTPDRTWPGRRRGCGRRLFAVAGCRAEGTPPADPGSDGVETALDAVEAEVSEP